MQAGIIGDWPDYSSSSPYSAAYGQWFPLQISALQPIALPRIHFVWQGKKLAKQYGP
jgi:hypothetical protein